jgi:hypothetical protein
MCYKSIHQTLVKLYPFCSVKNKALLAAEQESLCYTQKRYFSIHRFFSFPEFVYRVPTIIWMSREIYI